MRRTPAATALVEEHDAVTIRVKKAALLIAGLAQNHRAFQFRRDREGLQLPAAGQAWLDRYFVLQRAERTIFTSEFKILVCSKGAFDSLLPAPGSKSSTQDWTLELQGHALPVGSKATSGLFLPGSDLLTTEDIERLLNAVQTQAGADLLNAPKLTMFTRALGQLSTYDEIEYVKDWSLKVVEPGHKMIAVPEIGSVRDGLGVQVRGVQLDGDLLGLEVELWQSVVKQPIRTSNVHLDVDQVSFAARQGEPHKVAIVRQLRTHASKNPDGTKQGSPFGLKIGRIKVVRRARCCEVHFDQPSATARPRITTGERNKSSTNIVRPGEA